MLDRVPPPLTDHVTPADLRSFLIEAVSVTLSLPSTVVADAVTPMLIGAELPPQPDKLKMATKVTTRRLTSELVLRPERAKLFRNTGTSHAC